MLVDVFEVSAEGPTQVDWFAHALSDRVEPVEGLGEGEPASPGNADGYQHLTDARRWLVTGASRWDFVTADRRLRLWLADTGAEQVFAATGIGYWVNQKVPCLVRRHTGNDVRFVTVYDLSGSGQYVRAVEPSEGAALGVQAADGAWDIKFGMGGLTRCEHEPPAP
jgi:hypothetical protein